MMEKPEHTFDTAELMIAEIEILMIRLQEIDPDAILRLEKLMSKVRIRVAVQKHCH